MQVAVVEGGRVVLVERKKPAFPNKWNVKRMHKCVKCGAPHRRRVANVNPDLCSSCAKGLSQAKHRERKAERGLGRLEVGGV